jgi:hypothetical protein
MAEWRLHIPTEDNVFFEYKCGLIAGQFVKLRKDLAIHNHEGEPTGEIYQKGEVWQVLPGVLSDPVVWFGCPDGHRHTWDDEAAIVSGWFEVVSQNSK